jgi:hypothetical protein
MRIPTKFLLSPTVSMQNGTSMTVTPDAQGVAAVRVAAGSSVFFAAR